MLKQILNQFIFSISFLTCFPLSAKEISEQHIAKSVCFFSMVGFLIGAFLAGVQYAGKFLSLTNTVSSVLIVAAWLIVTRGLHFDGLTDIADGFWGGNTPEQRLHIMKDSRIGAFGMAAGTLLIVGKIIFISDIAPKDLVPALLFIPAIARVTPSIISLLAPHSAQEGLGAIFVKNAKVITLVIASLSFLIPSYFILTLTQIFAISAGALLVSIILVHAAHQKIGGVNGDVFGAAIEITEWLSLLIFCITKNYRL